jgi:hypothetical protein
MDFVVTLGVRCVGAGQVLSFAGGSVRHGGQTTTRGVRYILAIFAYLSAEPQSHKRGRAGDGDGDGDWEDGVDLGAGQSVGEGMDALGADDMGVETDTGDRDSLQREEGSEVGALKRPRPLAWSDLVAPQPQTTSDIGSGTGSDPSDGKSFSFGFL